MFCSNHYKVYSHVKWSPMKKVVCSNIMGQFLCAKFKTCRTLSSGKFPLVFSLLVLVTGGTQRQLLVLTLNSFKTISKGAGDPS